MRKLYFLVFVLFFAMLINAQQKNMIIDEKSGKSMLIGKSCVADFQDTAFASWWNDGFTAYLPDTALVDSLKGKLQEIDITIVLATWCGDSRREVPRFYKLLDVLKYPVEKINMVCVDRKKKGVGSETDGLRIELVPTFIFYRFQKEIGRIIESPNESLEKDLFEILNKALN